MILIIIQSKIIAYLCACEKYFNLSNVGIVMSPFIFEGDSGIGMENESKIHHRKSLH